MANLVITTANSDSDGIANADASNNILVTEGAFVTSPGGDALAFSGSGDHIVSVDGTVGSATSDAIQISAGGVRMTVGQSGYVSGLTDVAIRLTGSTSSEINNAGTIAGFNAILCDNGADFITNTGLIIGFVGLQGGADSLTNSGTIADNINTGQDDDIIRNLGVIEAIVALGEGADIYDGRGGTITGAIIMNTGDDIVFGGDGVEVISASGGSDGNDFIDGGGGNDTYDASLASAGIIVDLDDGLASSLNAGTGIGNDHLENIENVTGSNSADQLFGNDIANVLIGLDGDDVLFGRGGSDRLDGEEDSDTLVGGLGRDLLTGGAQNDIFDFNSVAESGINGATRDRILDFEDGGDIIDLSTIDAIVGKPGNQAFKFVAGAFTKAGQVHAFVNDAGNTVVEVNIDQDKAAEMSIVLIGNFALTQADFDL